jgi:hypothetical protein
MNNTIFWDSNVSEESTVYFFVVEEWAEEDNK